MRNKLGAFTVLEVLFTLLLSAIIISMVYSIYSTFSGQTYKLFKEVTNTSEVHTFFSKMNEEVYKAQNVFYDKKKLVLHSYNDTNILYHYDKDSLKRYQNDLFTGSIFVKDFKVQQNSKRLDGRVIKIQYSTSIFGEEVSFDIIKNYPEIINYGY